MTELKNIPNGWVETTLNAVAEIKYGKDHKHLKDGDIPCLGSGGLMRFVDEILYDKPSVLIPRKGTISNLFFIDEPFWTVDTLFYTKINENKIIPKYLYFKLKTINLENMDVGSAVPSLTTAVLNQIEIVIPKDIEEQKSIAYILTAFDDKIELLQSQNKTLEEMAQTIFVEWFGKYSIEDELPDGWRVGKLGDFNAVIADFVANGSFASLKENVTLYDYEEYALFMRNTDLKSGFAQKTYVDKQAYEFLSKTKLYGGEIIISNVGDVGSVHFCPYFDIPMTLGNNVIMLKSEFQFYFYTMFNSKIGQHLISSITGGSAQPKFNKTDFRNMGMIIPSEEILIKFENVASKLYLKILKNKEQIQMLTKTRDELLPRLMSGEVRVNEFKN
jgi:type I restriction enzyme S subunit